MWADFQNLQFNSYKKYCEAILGGHIPLIILNFDQSYASKLCVSVFSRSFQHFTTELFLGHEMSQNKCMTIHTLCNMK